MVNRHCYFFNEPFVITQWDPFINHKGTANVISYREVPVKGGILTLSKPNTLICRVPLYLYNRGPLCIHQFKGTKFGNVNTDKTMFTPFGIEFMGIEAQDNMGS